MRFHQAFYSGFFDPLKQSIFFQTARWHANPINENWAAVERRALNTLYTCVAPPRGDAARVVERLEATPTSMHGASSGARPVAVGTGAQPPDHPPDEQRHRPHRAGNQGHLHVLGLSRRNFQTGTRGRLWRSDGAAPGDMANAPGRTSADRPPVSRSATRSVQPLKSVGRRVLHVGLGMTGQLTAKAPHHPAPR